MIGVPAEKAVTLEGLGLAVEKTMILTTINGKAETCRESKGKDRIAGDYRVALDDDENWIERASCLIWTLGVAFRFVMNNSIHRRHTLNLYS